MKVNKKVYDKVQPLLGVLFHLALRARAALLHQALLCGDMESVQCMHSPRPMRGVALHERHALAAFCQASASDSTTTFRCLNADALAQLAEQLGGDESCRSKVLSAALLRRLVHGHRSKLVGMSSPATWEATLAQVDVLPESLGAHLADKYGGYPKTWLDAIQQLQIHAQGSKEKLWRLLDSHAILEYVPVQCQTCGHVVPDDIRSGKSDVEVRILPALPSPCVVKRADFQTAGVCCGNDPVQPSSFNADAS
eukprot:2485386-Pleurochrysis_carterae.AAC.2